MYFRTVTDLAPEITRFNGHGLEETGLTEQSKHCMLAFAAPSDSFGEQASVT